MLKQEMPPGCLSTHGIVNFDISVRRGILMSSYAGNATQGGVPERAVHFLEQTVLLHENTMMGVK